MRAVSNSYLRSTDGTPQTPLAIFQTNDTRTVREIIKHGSLSSDTMKFIRTGDMRPKISIHGSCVTRDLAEFHDYEVLHYQARSSLCTKSGDSIDYDSEKLSNIQGCSGNSLAPTYVLNLQLNSFVNQ